MPRLDGINKYINHLISDSLFDEVVGDFNVAVETQNFASIQPGRINR